MKRKYCDRINHRHFKNFDFVPFEKFFFKLLQSLGVNWDVRCAWAVGRRGTFGPARNITSSHTSRPGIPAPPAAATAAFGREGRAVTSTARPHPRRLGRAETCSEAHGTRPPGEIFFVRTTCSASCALINLPGRRACWYTSLEPDQLRTRNNGIDAIPGPQGRFVEARSYHSYGLQGLGRRLSTEREREACTEHQSSSSDHRGVFPSTVVDGGRTSARSPTKTLIPQHIIGVLYYIIILYHYVHKYYCNLKIFPL